MKINGNGDIVWNWRDYFTQSNLEYGRQDADRGKILFFESDPEGRWAKGRTEGGFNVMVNQAPADFAEYLKYPDWRKLSGGYYASGIYAYKNYYSCNCAQGSTGTRCRHLAALMFKWEEIHGPFVMNESAEARAERLKREAEMIKWEREAALIKKKQANRFDAVEFFRNRALQEPAGLRFSPGRILKESNPVTNQYEAEQADALIASGQPSEVALELGYGFGGRQTLTARAVFDKTKTRIVLDPSEISSMTCSCGRTTFDRYRYWYNRTDPSNNTCCHALALWHALRREIIRENPGDDTDYNGQRLLEMLTGQAVAVDAGEEENAVRKKRDVMLIPRVVQDKNSAALKLGFDIGRAGERAYAVKNIESLVKAAENGTGLAMTKTASIHFDRETFTDEAQTWYQLITSRVRAVERVNARLANNFGRSSRLSVGAGIPLEESDLDIIYDMVDGKTILYQYGGRNETREVRVGEAHPGAELTLEPVKRGNRLTGVAISGTLPRLLRGNLHRYILDQSAFGRVSDDELSFLEPFHAIEDGKGCFRCVIGEKKFAEFYHRVLPVLQDMPQIRVDDRVGSLIEAVVPPAPEFIFYIDIEDAITCRVDVQYGERAFALGTTPEDFPANRRDRDQENRVRTLVRDFFPAWNAEARQYACDNDEDNLMRVLTDGVRALSRFGEVKGSDAFNRVHVRPAPQPRLSVQIEGGLLDLSIRTKDLSDDELLALLASYRLKKRWHRLGSGDFVNLNDTWALDELDETARTLDIDMEALVGGGVRLPKYRALYVDRMLEAHNEIASSRDKHFKALVRSFQTIRDSDFDAPEALADVLRPYQLYGFRWLSTLSQAGFGGILADEMGLGKTVQMLAFIQSLRERGEQRPALVVCPASLVYNWREECRKFTPGLSVGVIAGTLSQRRAQIKRLNGDTALYVTSYDLLKRDIALYDGVTFSTVVLDEAQYIKNRQAAVSKAVRVLNAEHRFALTGTPIENRLSELWSIFDFLMPGFLYTTKAFSERFENPIMKQKDENATATLSRMTEPFILRRRKEDVLKDLPEKLEENRCAEMESDQRRLYDAQLVQMRNVLESSGDSGEDKLRVLAQITRLRQLCCDPSLLFDDYKGTSAKRAACLELIQNAMDAGHRMLVFSQFTSMLDLLAADLKQADIPFYTLTGATPKEERVRLVNAFNHGDTPVFLISLKAGGTGLNLTGADVVIHYDPWWNLAVQNQATDRAHRIGQTKQVTVIKLIAADTIEEKIVELQQTKRDLAEAILTGRNTSLMSLSKEELMALLG